MAHMSYFTLQPKLLRTCRYLLKISYIGTNYKGLQRQTRRDQLTTIEDGTIQSAIEKCLDRALCPVYGSRLALSSRTDAGVHAYMNTANVDLTHPLVDTIYKPSFITDATNKILSFFQHEIIILETRLVGSYFHSRANAKWRSYVYRFAVVQCDLYSDLPQQLQYEFLRAYLPISQINRCHIIGSIDIDLVKKSCDILRGQHNFILFTTLNKENIDKDANKCIDEFRINFYHPIVDTELINRTNRKIDFYEIFIKANSFLYNQVRRMVSAVLDVGLGRITLDELEDMLQPPFKKPKTLSQMAPACGLYLNEVGYDPEDFILTDNFNEYSPREHYDDDLFEEDSFEE